MADRRALAQRCDILRKSLSNGTPGVAGQMVYFEGIPVSPVMGNALLHMVNVGFQFEVLSGYRSEEIQTSLRRRWDAGDREGLAAPPALDSLHTTGDAVDLFVRPEQALDFRTVWVDTLGGRWGGAFLPRDPNHYDLGRRTIRAIEIKLV